MSLDKNELKALIGILQKLVEDNIEDNEEEPKKKSGSKKTDKPKMTPKGRRRQNYQEHTNMFLDMPEARMHKDDTLIDQKLRKFPPTPRNRPISLINVNCRVCGKKETISSKILPDSPDRYKCNSCSQSGG